jgi:hypothetical protein
MVVYYQFLGGRPGVRVDIHFSVVPKRDRTKNVLVMFEPSGTAKAIK